AAIEVPALATPQGSAPSQGRAAAAALDALAGGDAVVLRQGEAGSDRYGPLLAYGYVIRDGDQFLLQRDVGARGFALVGDRVGRPCSDDLVSRESSARADKLGLWADPYYEVLNAELPRRTCWRIEANLRWSRAKSRPYGKAGVQSLSISGGGG